MQLLYVNEKTVRSSLLKQIIEFCVPRKLLRAIYLWGMRGNEIHAKMFITIDYDNDKSRINIFSSNGHEFTRQEAGDPPCAKPTPHAPDRPMTCPVWAQAIEFFTQLCEDGELYLTWHISWRDQWEEMNKKFGFGQGGGSSCTTVDKTSGAPVHKIPHSILSELMMTTGFSEEVRGALAKPVLPVKSDVLDAAEVAPTSKADRPGDE